MWLQVVVLWLHIVELLQKLSPLLTTSLWSLISVMSFCLLGERCSLFHWLRQPLRFCADCSLGVAVGVLVPNMPKDNRAIGTPPLDVFDVRYSL